MKRIAVLTSGGDAPSYRKTAKIVGVLFIIATGANLLTIPFVRHINAPDYLINVSANATQVTIGALLESIMAVACVGIAIAIFPVLKKKNEALALGYVGARIIEGVIYIVVAVIGRLLLLTLSQEFVKAGAPDVPYFQTLGTLLLATHDWAFVLATLAFTLSALILNYLLYQSKLVPRFISVWGLIGAALLLAGNLLAMFGLLTETSVWMPFIFLPIASQEMFLAGWLIVKGFNSSAIASMSAKTDANEVK